MELMKSFGAAGMTMDNLMKASVLLKRREAPQRN